MTAGSRTDQHITLPTAFPCPIGVKQILLSNVESVSMFGFGSQALTNSYTHGEICRISDTQVGLPKLGIEDLHPDRSLTSGHLLRWHSPVLTWPWPPGPLRSQPLRLS